jgi:hypothetical protein
METRSMRQNAQSNRRLMAKQDPFAEIEARAPLSESATPPSGADLWWRRHSHDRAIKSKTQRGHLVPEHPVQVFAPCQ